MSEDLSIRFPEHLPVSAVRDEIADLISRHQVVVVAGETGSGKTTQLPKICLALGRKRIGHTQPRRIAARSVAERIAEELEVELGSVVGYQVRFTDHSSKQTRVKLMTDGILLNELQHDRMLSAYDTLIIDEAHERSLNIDFILGYLKQLLPKRPDLKVIVTSATIDPEKLARHFADADTQPAPVLEVSGRTYPVEIRYRPLLEPATSDASSGEDADEILVRDPTEAVVDAVGELLAEGPGDILVFLPGEREIRDLADVFSKASASSRGVRGGFDVLPLYGRLSAAEQHRVFERHTRRRVVLATNVAETSLTVPGIRYVVDAGLARISRYSHRSKVQRLPIEPISRASAQQRSGRCGRVEAGVAIRLYSEEDFESRPEFTEPEILRTNLASVILQMIALGLGDMSRFPFVDPPDQRQVTAGVQLLEELGALAAPGSGRRRTGARQGAGAHRLTPLGRNLARIPVDPRIGRMILEADRRGCLREVLVIAAALSIPDPRERPLDQQQQADASHARFRHESSDFLTLHNLWRYIREQQRALSSSAFRRMCRKEHLNYLRIREWQELESQLRRVAKDLGLATKRSVSTEPAQTQPAQAEHGAVDEDGIHQALLAGLLSHIGMKDVRDRAETRSGAGTSGRRPERRGVEYLGSRNTRFAIFPGSGLAKRPPDFVMAAELVETSRLFARTTAAIKPEWAERIGAHLVQRSYSEPHWSKRRAAVMAHERVTLYGVPLIADRLTSYAKHDPALARELFIRHALVYGEWHTRHRFFHQNRSLLEEAEELEHRARRKDIVVDEHTLFDFYDERIPDDVVSGAHFDAWWRRERAQRPDLLRFDPAMLVRDEVDRSAFPDQWHEGSLSLPLRYHFEPGARDDGVSVDVPVATLNQVPVASFSWQVPGLREELVIALLRSLPKSLRTSFVPAPDYARAFLATASPGEESLLDALERHLRSQTGVHVPREAWDWGKVPAHLRPTFRVVADDGVVLTQGKDLEVLRGELSITSEGAIATAGADMTIAGARDWAFGTIEQTFTRSRAGHEVLGYPGLVDETGDGPDPAEPSVGLQVFGSVEERDASHLRGQRRLLALRLPSPARAVASGLGNAEKLALAGAPYPGTPELLADCVLAAVAHLAPEPIWDEADFERTLAEIRPRLEDTTRAVLADVLRTLEAWRKAERALTGAVEISELPAMTDMQAQVGRLVYRGFIADVGAAHLRHLPRYLAAVVIRRDRLAAGVHADRELMAQVTNLQDLYLHRRDALPQGRPAPAALTRVRWLLEELRVSLWAQSLGTAEKVSDARIRKALAQA